MHFRSSRSLALIATLALTFPVFAQTSDPGVKQDMKNAGTDTKHATTSAGHGVSEGSKTAYDKSKSGTEKGYNKTKSGTEKGYDKTKAGTEKGYDKTKSGTKTAQKEQFRRENPSRLLSALRGLALSADIEK